MWYCVVLWYLVTIDYFLSFLEHSKALASLRAFAHVSSWPVIIFPGEGRTSAHPVGLITDEPPFKPVTVTLTT